MSRTDSMFSVKVDNVSFNVRPDDLRRVFEKFGEIGDVYVPKSREMRGGSIGFAFVRFIDKRDAQDAADELNGSRFEDHTIRCEMARTRGNAPSRRSRSRSPPRRRASRSRSRSPPRRRASRSRSRSPRRSPRRDSRSPRRPARRDSASPRRSSRKSRSRSPRR